MQPSLSRVYLSSRTCAYIIIYTYRYEYASIQEQQQYNTSVGTSITSCGMRGHQLPLARVFFEVSSFSSKWQEVSPLQVLYGSSTAHGRTTAVPPDTTAAVMDEISLVHDATDSIFYLFLPNMDGCHSRVLHSVRGDDIIQQ